MKISIFTLAAIYILAAFGEHKWVVLALSILLIYKYALEKLPTTQQNFSPTRKLATFNDSSENGSIPCE